MVPVEAADANCIVMNACATDAPFLDILNLPAAVPPVVATVPALARWSPDVVDKVKALTANCFKIISLICALPAEKTDISYAVVPAAPWDPCVPLEPLEPSAP
jgi:hypothetical protein